MPFLGLRFTALRAPDASALRRVQGLLRSDGARDHPGMPFAFLSELAFSFAGIPTTLGKSNYDREGKLHEQPAKVIIVCCNGIGTPRLLLNSKSNLSEWISEFIGACGQELIHEDGRPHEQYSIIEGGGRRLASTKTQVRHGYFICSKTDCHCNRRPSRYWEGLRGGVIELGFQRSPERLSHGRSTSDSAAACR
jgi:hypothetical protein